MADNPHKFVTAEHASAWLWCADIKLVLASEPGLTQISVSKAQVLCQTHKSLR